MVRVSQFQIDSVRMWFWSMDHQPPHFHIEHEGGEWSAKVFFLEKNEEMIQDIHSRKTQGIPNKVKKELISKVRDFRAELLSEWERIHSADK